MEDMGSLKKRRATIKGSITKLINYIKTISDSTQVEDIKVRLCNIERLRDDFNKVEDKIVALDNAEEMDTEFEENYYKIVAGLNHALRIKSEPKIPLNDTIIGDTSNSANHTDVKLPKITIPVFTGDYTEWQSFFDLFCSTIQDNPRLTPSQKLQYLKGSLEGEAAGLLKHFSITDANYIEAMNKLRLRYDRKKHTIYSFIKKFMSQPIITAPSSINVRKLLDTSDEVIRGLKALGDNAESRDHWLIHILIGKLDDESNALWAQSSSDSDSPTLKEFFDFLLKRIDALESVRNLNRRQPPHAIQTRPLNIKTHLTSTSEPCALCPETYHKLFECDKFKKMEVDQRRDFLKNQNRCFNCLNNNHGVYNCNSRFRCKYCSRKHHSLLHEDYSDSASKPDSVVQAVQLENEQCDTTNYTTTIGTALLPTALVNVIDGYKVKRTCRVLLDSGSQGSFITEYCTQRLNLKRNNAKLTVSGIGGLKTGYTKGSVALTITPRNHDEPQIQLEALILPKLTTKQPQNGQSVDLNCYNKFDLADPYFYKSAEIDILIGADTFFELLVNEKVQTNNKLTLQKTVLGWIVAGKLPNNQDVKAFTTTTSNNEENLDCLLRKFWEIETVETPATKLSDEEIACEEHYKETHKIDASGRFMVCLPFKLPPTTIGDSIYIATQRMRAMERKFSKNETFAARYKQFMAEYISLGHMKPISETKQKARGYYLPHHGVTKESSITTKLRVVFDGSAKSTSGKSLNDCLLVGPTVQSNIYEILSRFREFRVAFTSDIEKMFRQVHLAEKDRKYHRIIWRDSPNVPFQHFELQTVTYGTACATFLATRTLNEVADRNKDKYPEAATRILNNIYVDDLMTGADSIEQAIELKNQIQSILLNAGFALRKWLANKGEVLLPTDDLVDDTIVLEIEESNSVKVLGLNWNPTKDTFQFNVNLNEQPVLTKRGVLSEASRLFDPLGWIAPITVCIKIFLQSLWAKNLDWDEQLPREAAIEWLQMRNSLPKIEEIEIPRYIQTDSTTKLELHGFSDASKDAYSAVVYGRIINLFGESTIALLSAKTKVSPVKQVSVPRLELCGAVLLKKLLFTIKKALKNQIIGIYAWTDSTIVLDWLSAHPKKWNTFVANRTSEILQDMNRSQWRHVASQDNPADCASRGLDPKQLFEFDLWWHGPKWLTNSEDWPRNKEICTNGDDTETAEKTQSTLLIEIPENMLINQLSKRFSSFNKLIRVIAYVLKYINIKLKRVTSKKYWMTELQEAERLIFRHIQDEHFGNEIQRIKAKKSLLLTSRLKYFQPFIDDVGLLRVGGRLANSNAKYDVKHPIILPAKNQVVENLVKDHHLRHLHAGPTLMMSTLRSKYWIIGCRNLLRKIVHSCVKCVKYNAREMNQIMGDLPVSRVEFIKPFFKVGIDYAGPFLTHIVRRRGQRPCKSYVCLFVCMSTKAVHIELVSNLTTDAFIGALRRFIARRGVCSEIHSDNGSNFVGAANQLNELFNFLNSNATTFSKFLSTDRIAFKFIPPSSPHFGGLWEAAVKSTKFHLKRVTDGHTLTVEEMTTLLAEIEAVLNSRPICMLSSEQLDYLTPAHFLIGRPTTTLPSKDIEEVKLSKLSRWQLIQQMTQHFWRRWHQEYLTNLQQRSKWQKAEKNVEIGDLVVIKDNNLPTSKWMIGRIIELHPGPDGNIRVVTLKTANGDTKRPIKRLCLLPTS